MHFQTPPEGQAKLVFCVVGEVVDVILDLRRGSPSFGRHHAFTLSADAGAGVYVPTGCAHGFAALGESNLLFYKLTGAFSAAQFRDRLGNGRQLAIQILEYFDRRGLTLRRGDLRRVAKDPAGVFGATAAAG